MRQFFREVQDILENRRQAFVSAYAHAVVELAAKAWMSTDDENRVKQDLSNLLKRGFRGLYTTLAMKMDIMKELPPL